MIRKLLVAVTAAAVIAAGSIVTASARGGSGGSHGGGMGGHGGMGGMGHSGAGMGRGMGFPHANVGRPGVGPFVRGRNFAFPHHRFFRHRFFVGVYGDDCWTRVWTRRGWRWLYACY
jgi:hypothetical protein